MTDAAIAGGGAPAPAETGAVIEEAPSYHEPLPSQTPVTEKPAKAEPEKPKSLSETVRQANEKIKAETAAKAKEPEQPKVAKEAPKETAKAAEKPAEAPKDNRAPDGKFVSQKPQEGVQTPAPQAQEAPKQTAYKDAPSRFDDGAKAEWEKVPESVRGAVHRALTENERGIQKYKADAEAFHSIREFDDLAKKTGTDLKSALSNYVGIEQMLRKDPISGLERVIANIGLQVNGRPATLRDIAAHVLGQKPEEASAKTEAALQSALREIETLKQQIGGVTQTIEQQRTSQTEAQVVAFAKDHPRFDELAADIEFFLSSGRTKDLSEAYELAERLNPAPVQPQNPAPLTPAPTAQAQTLNPQPAPLKPAGQKSISGAPSSGVTPQANGPVPSIKEALRRGMSRAG